MLRFSARAMGVTIYGRLLLVALTARSIACSSPAAPQVVIYTAGGSEIVVPVEIADDNAERSRGLMYRTDLAANAGMLFLFDAEQPRAFWMKNTPLPLDILYIAGDGRIVAIAEHTKPFSTDPIPSRTPALNVLEVNAGFAKRNGIAVGDRVSLKKAVPVK